MFFQNDFSNYSLQDYKTAVGSYTKIPWSTHSGHPFHTILQRNTQCVIYTLVRCQLDYLGLILPTDPYEQILRLLIADSTNHIAKHIRTQTASTEQESDDPSITFTAANITHQKAFHDGSTWDLSLACQALGEGLL